MELTLIRNKSQGNSTLGVLFVDGKLECYTLEDVVRDVKVHGKTAIPRGRYNVTVTMSNRFKKLLPLLANVPNFEGVRIHPGNTSEDTEGCILVGVGTALVNGSPVVTDSRTAFSKLFSKIQACKTSITLEIK